MSPVRKKKKKASQLTFCGILTCPKGISIKRRKSAKVKRYFTIRAIIINSIKNPIFISYKPMINNYEKTLSVASLDVI